LSGRESELQTKAVILETLQSHQSPPPTPCLSRGAARPAAPSLSLRDGAVSPWKFRVTAVGALIVLLGSSSPILQVSELTSVMQLQNPRAWISTPAPDGLKIRDRLCFLSQCGGLVGGFNCSHCKRRLLWALQPFGCLGQAPVSCGSPKAALAGGCDGMLLL